MISGSQCIIFGMEKCVEFLVPCGIVNAVELLAYCIVLYTVLGSLSG